MSNVQSYNALIDRFKAFASGHFILKSFSHGQIDTADLEKFTEYPFMHVVPSNVTYAKGMKTFSFQIVLADLPRDKDDKVEFQREVLSDLQRIAEDLVAEITNHRVLFGDLITVQNVSLEPFLEEFHNTLTGWTVSLDLLVPYYWDACSIPAEWNDYFETGTGGVGSILSFSDSLVQDEFGNVTLVNDEANPAPNYYYGTNDEGVRGWYLLTDEVGLTCATIGTCQTIIDIEAEIDLLQQDVTDLQADVVAIETELPNKVPYTGATGNVDLGEYELKAGQIEFDTTPTGTAGAAVMRWNDTDGTVDVGLKGGNVTLQVGQESVVRVVNKTGADLLEANYQAVRVRLVSEGGAQGQRLAVVLALADTDADSATTIGLVTETINNNQEGFITTSGEVRGINTTGSLQGETWVDGDILYLSGTTAGRVTNIKPSGPTHTIIIGYVVYAHQNNGKIFVKVDNGYELDELHNVSITSPANNNVLTYESSTSLWKNKTVETALGYTPVPTTRSITINGTTQDLSADRTFSVGTVTSVAALTLGTTGTDLSSTVATGTTTPVITLNVPTASATNRGVLSSVDWSTFNGKFNLPSLTSGSVLFSNGTTIAQDNANLFWDDTNNRLGIGTATPAARLDSSGTIRTTATTTPSSGAGVEISYSTLGNIFSFDRTAGQYKSLNLNDKMLVAANGNVLINTTTDAGYRLDVNGTARVQGNAQFGTGFYWDNTNNRLGINTASPSQRLTVIGVASTAPTNSTWISSGSPIGSFYGEGAIGNMDFFIGGASSTALSRPVLVGRKSGGTLAVPTALAIGDSVFSFLSSGYSGTQFLNTASINMLVDGTVSSTSVPQAITFETGTTSRSERMRIASSGNLLVGTTTDAGYKLDVNGTARIQNQLITTGSISAASAVARGTYLNQTLVATANNDTLYGLDIFPTFNTGSFTGVNSVAMRIRNASGNIFYLDSVGNATLGASLGVGSIYSTANMNFSSGSGDLRLQSNFNVNTGLTMFRNTRNFVIQDGGTFTDAGYRLDVQGTSRFTGGAIFNSSMTIGGATAINNSLAVGTNQPAVASAQLEVVSTTRGFLPPRQTLAQRTAIASPAVGLIVYQTDLVEGLYVYKSTGWQFIA